MQSEAWYRERVPKASLTEEEQAMIRRDWDAHMGRSFTASFAAHCPNRYHDAATLILRHMATQKESGGYVLRRGVAFRYKGKIYTANNITAAAAEWWIGQDLMHRDDFETLAKDYDAYDTNTHEPAVLPAGSGA